MTEKTPQSPPKEQESLYSLCINGKRAHPRDAKRILTIPATPVDKDDRYEAA